MAHMERGRLIWKEEDGGHTATMKPPFSLLWWVFLDEALVLSLESTCTPAVLHGCKLFPLRCSFFAITLFSTSEVDRGKHGLLASCSFFQQPSFSWSTGDPIFAKLKMPVVFKMQTHGLFGNIVPSQGVGFWCICLQQAPCASNRTRSSFLGRVLQSAFGSLLHTPMRLSVNFIVATLKMSE